MIVQGAREVAAGKRRNARQERVLPVLLGLPCRAQPPPGLGHRP